MLDGSVESEWSLVTMAWNLNRRRLPVSGRSIVLREACLCRPEVSTDLQADLLSARSPRIVGRSSFCRRARGGRERWQVPPQKSPQADG